MVVRNQPISGKEAPRRRHCSPGRFRQQVSFLRRQFLQDSELPFTDLLTEDVIVQALTVINGWLDRIFTSLVTLWVFDAHLALTPKDQLPCYSLRLRQRADGLVLFVLQHGDQSRHRGRSCPFRP